MWPQAREGTGSDTAVHNFTFHPLLLSSSGIKKPKLDKGVEPNAISALLLLSLQETCTVEEQQARDGGPRMTWGFGCLCSDPDVCQALGTQQLCLQ